MGFELFPQNTRSKKRMLDIMKSVLQGDDMRLLLKRLVKTCGEANDDKYIPPIADCP